MPTAIGVDELCTLPGVGPATARDLLDEGYNTYENLAEARPMELHQRCDIVISNTAMIIGAAVDNLDGNCPECHSSDVSPIFRAWSDTLEDASETDSHLVCDCCHWNGKVEELE